MYGIICVSFMCRGRGNLISMCIFFVLSYSISMLIMFCNKSLHDLSL